MKPLPKKLQEKLEKREAFNSLRKLSLSNNLIDFYSNDYLGFAKSKELKKITNQILSVNSKNGSTGSRLISGNSSLYEQTEHLIANFHSQESALIFNSGYNANVGFFSSVPQRGDVVFYDELIHASIRDGLTMSLAQSLKFRHNDFKDLIKKSEYWKTKNKGEIYVVTESVFSMDGDAPNLIKLVQICEQNNFLLVVDEAHALGVFDKKGQGLINELQLQQKVLAQIVTFGKALGCHGAAILGSAELSKYLVNFSRSFIYTTALSPHSVATINAGYELLSQGPKRISELKQKILKFKLKLKSLNIEKYFIESNSAIQSCLIPGNDEVKKIALLLYKEGFDVKPILSPTVPEGKERLRFCLHTYNTNKEIDTVLTLVSHYLLK